MLNKEMKNHGCRDEQVQMCILILRPVRCSQDKECNTEQDKRFNNTATYPSMHQIITTTFSDVVT